MGRSEEALAQAQTAMQLDPLDLHVHRLLADHFVTIRQFNVAADRARKTLELESTYVPAYWVLVQAYGGLGEYEEVLNICEHGMSYAEDDTVLQAFRGWAYGKLGRRAEAEALLNQLIQRRRNGYFSGFLIAVCYDGLGDIDGAVKWLTRAYEDCDGLCPALNVWFMFDPLRSDPRFP